MGTGTHTLSLSLSSAHPTRHTHTFKCTRTHIITHTHTHTLTLSHTFSLLNARTNTHFFSFKPLPLSVILPVRSIFVYASWCPDLCTTRTQPVTHKLANLRLLEKNQIRNTSDKCSANILFAHFLLMILFLFLFSLSVSVLVLVIFPLFNALSAYLPFCFVILSSISFSF